MVKDGPVSIGLCADTHYWPGGRDYITPDGTRQLQSSSEQLLTTLLDELENADLDLVIHLGDLTCGGGTYDMPVEVFLGTLSTLHSAYHKLTTPVHLLPGNHDSTPGLGGWEGFHAILGGQPGIGATVDTPDARLILLNTQGHSRGQIETADDRDPVYGWVSESELARVEADLASAAGRPVMVFMHQLLQPWSNRAGWRDFYGIANALAVRNLLRLYQNAQIVIQAHAHRLDVQTVLLDNHPRTFVVVPSLIEYPVAWVRLDITAHAVRLRLQPLPLPELRSASQSSGEGQKWRAGREEWWDLTIPFKPI
jgi:3',5'-cyclic AMP phosphodiesterase CpdA